MRTSKPAKPTEPIRRALRLTWYAWILITLIVYPLTVSLTTGASVWAGVGVQLLALMPALIFTPWVYRGTSAYALMWASMVLLVYLGVGGVLALLRIYEQAPTAVGIIKIIEFLILLMINYQLFVLLKRLPAMHKQFNQTK
ncbi:hypothetical protein [Moraxella catarrhalis]|uniref:DUF2069 domain-containing protein n=1 Tax=Moraxella catarrhalis TaxID=480 RepID=A0A198UFQ4_MORCA|nr:hypothetical protein [Moraxella catarrhalis]OAU95164.1 hypothetical protein AO384_1698 [Moraxella catarrhalis]OAU99222.1 hypothetical protein AO383_0292 [Moraxella catarrhalis]OAV03883.1 hypothetical protein AO385_0269 [Moraxella catarrhalis]